MKIIISHHYEPMFSFQWWWSLVGISHIIFQYFIIIIIISSHNPTCMFVHSISVAEELGKYNLLDIFHSYFIVIIISTNFCFSLDVFCSGGGGGCGYVFLP